jgi:hypothetical protein
MNKIAAPPPAVNARWEPKHPFDLVVAYEDTPTRNRAMQLYDHLAQQLLEDYDFQCSWWKLEHLRDRGLREESADAAADANMIILSLRGDRELPTVFKPWVESWLTRKDNHKSALVVLIGDQAGPKTDAASLQTYLQQIARRAKMDFFAHKFDLEQAKAGPGGTPAPAPAPAPPPPPTPRQFVPEEFLVEPPTAPRWGINE